MDLNEVCRFTLRSACVPKAYTWQCVLGTAQFSVRSVTIQKA